MTHRLNRFKKFLFGSTLALALGLGFAPASVTLAQDYEALESAGLKVNWVGQIRQSGPRGKLASAVLWQHNDQKRNYVEVVSPQGSTTRFFSDVLLDARNAIGARMTPEELEAAGKANAMQQATNFAKRWSAATVKPVIREGSVSLVSLVAAADDGTVQCIDAETGAIRWRNAVGSWSLPTSKLAVNDQYVAVNNGSSLYLLGMRDGRLIDSIRLKHVPAHGPALTDKYIYIPAATGQIDAYLLSDLHRLPWTYFASGHALAQPVTSYANQLVAWPTDSRKLFVAGGIENPAMQFRLQSQSVVTAAPAVTDDSFVTVNADGNVFRIQQTGRNDIVWRFSTGLTLFQQPIVATDAVYVVADSGALIAIDYATGKAVWDSSPRGVDQILAVSPTRIYYLTLGNQIGVLDRATGRAVGSQIPLSFRTGLVNTVNDRLYMLDIGGGVKCLREDALQEPVFHKSPVPVDETKKEDNKPAEQETNQMDSNTADPFGFGGGNADPFGTGAGAGGAMDDPFGSGF